MHNMRPLDAYLNKSVSPGKHSSKMPNPKPSDERASPPEDSPGETSTQQGHESIEIQNLSFRDVHPQQSRFSNPNEDIKLTESNHASSSGRTTEVAVPTESSKSSDSEMSADDEGPHTGPLSENQKRSRRSRRNKSDATSKQQRKHPADPSLRAFANPSKSANSSVSELSAQAAPVGSNPRMKVGSNLSPHEIPARRHKVPKPRKKATARVPESNGLTVAPPQDMLHLMRVTRGHIRGQVLVRTDSEQEWHTTRCIIRKTGNLTCEDKEATTSLEHEVADLRGVSVFALMEEPSGIPLLFIRSADQTRALQLRPKKQSQFNAWFAALLCWHAVPINQKPVSSDAGRWNLSRTASPPEQNLSRGTAMIGNKSESAFLLDQFREDPEVFPYIKQDLPSARFDGSLSKIYRTPVTCHVDEHGNFELYNNFKEDSSLAVMIQLSNFPRSAIQRIDRRVFDQDHVIGIYPQYAFSNDAVSQIRPIFLSFGSIEKFELWLVLLKAFASPELFGFDTRHTYHNLGGVNDILPGINKKSSSLFRIGASLTIRVNRAKFHDASDNSNALDSNKDQSQWHKDPSRSASSSGYYAEVLVDEQTKARTKISETGVWHEKLSVNQLSSLFSTVSVRIGKICHQSTRPSLDEFENPTNIAIGSSAVQVDSSNTEVYDFVGGVVLERTDWTGSFEDSDQWRPIIGRDGFVIGEMSLNIACEKDVIFEEGAYDTISEELQDFDNRLTIKIWRHIPSQLPKLTEAFLNIFLASGQVDKWLMSLADDEITNGTGNSSVALKHSSHLSEDSIDNTTVGKASISEASVLFRANTLFTRALDLYMKQVGMDYLEQTIGNKLRQIMREEVDCEVDPGRMSDASEAKLYHHWQRLHSLASGVWEGIYHSASKCPMELRKIFRQTRDFANARYGSVMPFVAYSSVSGFLFLRFFCAAVMTPHLFGLVKGSPGPNATRTFLLIAKSLQGLANMTTFGAKEPWMSPMNTFCSANRDKFKEFLDTLCDISSASKGDASHPASKDDQVYFRAEFLLVDEFLSDVHYSLDPRAREGLPSIPYLIDRPYNLAVLVNLWLKHFDADSRTPSRDMPEHEKPLGASVVTLKTLNSLIGEDNDLARFHAACQSIRYRIDATSFAHSSYNEKNSGGAENEATYMSPTVTQAWVKVAEHMERAPEHYLLREIPAPIAIRPEPSLVAAPPNPQVSPRPKEIQRPVSSGDKSETSQKGRGGMNSAGSEVSQKQRKSSESQSSRNPESLKKSSYKKKAKSPPRKPEENAMRKLGWM